MKNGKLSGNLNGELSGELIFETLSSNEKIFINQSETIPEHSRCGNEAYILLSYQEMIDFISARFCLRQETRCTEAMASLPDIYFIVYMIFFTLFPNTWKIS